MAYLWNTLSDILKPFLLIFSAGLCHVMPPVMATMSSAYQFVARLPHLLSSARWWISEVAKAGRAFAEFHPLAAALCSPRKEWSCGKVLFWLTAPGSAVSQEFRLVCRGGRKIWACDARLETSETGGVYSKCSCVVSTSLFMLWNFSFKLEIVLSRTFCAHR